MIITGHTTATIIMIVVVQGAYTARGRAHLVEYNKTQPISGAYLGNYSLMLRELSANIHGP